MLRADTYVKGEGSLVRNVIDGSLHGYQQTGIAGVANTGTDRNWCGSVFACANWHAFGRLAWNPSLSSADLADEWLRMTFTNDAAFVEPVEADDALVTPGGRRLHDAARPAPPDGTRPSLRTGAVGQRRAARRLDVGLLHRADAEGIGFDRTATGSNAVSQYAPPVRDRFASLERVPDDYLLWFHHVPWDYRMPSGQTLWNELTARYCRGVESVRDDGKDVARLQSFVDPERFEETRAFLGHSGERGAMVA